MPTLEILPTPSITLTLPEVAGSPQLAISPAPVIQITLGAGQGPAGPAGVDGLPGAQGLQGPAGADGLPGADGAQGLQGIQGPAGADGLPGADGAQGLQGLQGIQGPAGADGAQGLQGLQGIQGPAGADGAPGADGAQGIQGPAGADGAQGLQGIQGPAGADGAQGIQGIQGPAGTNGTNGASAYQIAVTNGFVGTEVEWLASLNGSSSATVYVGATAPDTAIHKQWFTETGRHFVYDGEVWFEVIGPAGPTGPAGADGADATLGGSVNSVQYNDTTGLGGAPNVQIEGGNLRLVTNAIEPTTPTADGLLLYAKDFAGRLLPKILGPSGSETALQAGLHGNSVFMVAPASGTTAPNVYGGTLNTAATMSMQFTAGSTNKWAATQRKRFQTSTTAANATGMRTAYVQWFRGSASGYGGFFFRSQYGSNINLNGGQKFLGLCASTAVLGGEPTALLNMCGVGYDSTDVSTGNWFFLRNDGAGTATKVDLGVNAARGTTQGWDLTMFMAPGGSTLYVRIVNINTGVVVLDTNYTTDLPTVNTGMAFKAEVRNGAQAAADSIEVAKVYIETDY